MNEIQFGTFDNKKFVPGVSKEAASNIVKYFGDWKITHIVDSQTNSIKNKKNYPNLGYRLVNTTSATQSPSGKPKHSIIFTRENLKITVTGPSQVKLEFTSQKNLSETVNTITSIIHESKFYKSLTGTETFIGEVPHVLTQQAFNRNVLTRNNYSVTDNGGGERYLLYIDTHGVFSFITKKLEFIHIRVPKPRLDYADTILDGEYINNTFYTTDVLFSKGKDFRQKKLTQRLDTLFDILMGLRLDFLRMKIIHVEQDNGIHEYPGNKLTKFTSIYEAAPKGGNLVFTPVDPTKDSFIWNQNTSINIRKGPPGNQFVLPTALQNYFGTRDTLEKLLIKIHSTLTLGGKFIGHTTTHKGDKKLLGQKSVDFKKFTQIMEKWSFKLVDTREAGSTVYFIFKKV